MDYTYNDYFNYYLKEFLNELINNFPDTKVNVLVITEIYLKEEMIKMMYMLNIL